MTIAHKYKHTDPVALANVFRPRTDVLPPVRAAKNPSSVSNSVHPLAQINVTVRPAVNTVPLCFKGPRACVRRTLGILSIVWVCGEAGATLIYAVHYASPRVVVLNEARGSRADAQLWIMVWAQRSICGLDRRTPTFHQAAGDFTRVRARGEVARGGERYSFMKRGQGGTNKLASARIVFPLVLVVE